MTETIVEQRTSLDRFADFIVRFVPDAITASVVLLLALAAFALALGNTPIQLADAYYKGFWSLLPFTSQMAISIVLGGALAATPWFQPTRRAHCRAARGSEDVFRKT